MNKLSVITNYSINYGYNLHNKFNSHNDENWLNTIQVNKLHITIVIDKEKSIIEGSW